MQANCNIYKDLLFFFQDTKQANFLFYWNGLKLCFVFVESLKKFFYWCSICQHIESHPVLIPSSASLSAGHSVTSTPCPPSFLPLLVCFLELGVSHVLSPFLIFPTHFFSFPLYSLSLFFIFPKWMDHIMFVLLWLTYFTQHNTHQIHPCQSK